MIVPLRTFHRRIAGHNDVSLIHVSAKDGVFTEEIELELRRLL